MSKHDKEGVKGFISNWANLGREKIRSIARYDSLVNVLSGIGTASDAGIAGRPSTANWLSDYDIEVLYATNDLARRIVDELVNDATKGGWSVSDVETGETVHPDPKHKIFKKINEAGRMGRLKGMSALVLIPANRHTDMSRPLTENEEIGNLLVVDSTEMSEHTWDDDPRSEFFGEAVLYQVSPDNQGGRSYNPVVHRSRMLIFEGDYLPERIESLNYGFPASVLQSCWPTVQRFTELEQNIANIVARLETATYSISGLASVLASDDGEQLLLGRLRLMQETVSAINAVVLDSDAGESYTRSHANLSGLDTIWDRFAHSAAKAAGMSMTQLFGMSPGGQSSDDESGRALWRKNIRSYQKNVLLPLLEKYYTFMNHGRPVSIVFGDLAELTPMEEADVAVKRSTARNLYAQIQIEGQSLLVHEAFRPMLKEEGILPKDFDYNVNPAPVETDEDWTESAFSPANPSGIANRTDNQDLLSGNDIPFDVRKQGEDVIEAWIRAYNTAWAQLPDDTETTLRDSEACNVAFDALEDKYTLPESARNNARKVLEWREEHGDEVQGMTEVGWRRARQLADNETIGVDTVKKMASFNRHRQNSEVAPEHEREPWRDAGYVAWLGWGGDTGVDWARNITGAADSEEE